MTAKTKRLQIDDVVWLVELTRHRYIKYITKRAIITDIEIYIWKGGEQTVYQTDLDYEADRKIDDIYLNQNDAVKECKKRNKSAKQYRVAERKHKRREQRRMTFKGQMLSYNDKDWRNLLNKPQTGAKE